MREATLVAVALRTLELRALIKTAEVINPELPEDAENLGDFLNELGINNEARDFYANGLRYGVPFWLLKKWYSTYKNTYMGYWDPSYLYRGKKASTGPIGYGSGVGKMGSLELVVKPLISTLRGRW